MNKKELFEQMGKGIKPSTIPFIPTIFAHSAKVIGVTPSAIAQDEDLLVKSQLECYELYQHDLISVGVDIYNVEYEALGAKVKFHDNEELPAISDVLVKEESDLAKLKVPDPETAGRMPMFLSAVKKIHDKVGNEVIVNGTVIGPFTLAAIMRGFENFIMDLIYNPEFAFSLMEFSNEVSLAYAKSFIKRGVGLSINESWIAPPLLSPTFYQDYVVDYEKQLVMAIKEAGQKNVALISGGNTTDIVNDMATTGTSLLLADSECDRIYYKKVCKENNILMRASIPSQVVEDGDSETMKKHVKQVIDDCYDYSGFIFGCGIVSYNTLPENVIKLKNMVNDYSKSLSL